MTNMGIFLVPSTDDSEDYDDSYDEEEPYVSVSKEFLMNVKNRALMLEQDQLIAQTIDLRSQLEEEKQKRMKAEAELKATSTLLEVCVIFLIETSSF